MFRVGILSSTDYHIPTIWTDGPSNVLKIVLSTNISRN